MLEKLFPALRITYIWIPSMGISIFSKNPNNGHAHGGYPWACKYVDKNCAVQISSTNYNDHNPRTSGVLGYLELQRKFYHNVKKQLNMVAASQLPPQILADSPPTNSAEARKLGKSSQTVLTAHYRHTYRLLLHGSHADLRAGEHGCRLPRAPRPRSTLAVPHCLHACPRGGRAPSTQRLPGWLACLALALTAAATTAAAAADFHRQEPDARCRGHRHHPGGEGRHRGPRGHLLRCAPPRLPSRRPPRPAVCRAVPRTRCGALRVRPRVPRDTTPRRSGPVVRVSVCTPPCL